MDLNLILNVFLLPQKEQLQLQRLRTGGRDQEGQDWDSHQEVPQLGQNLREPAAGPGAGGCGGPRHQEQEAGDLVSVIFIVRGGQFGGFWCQKSGLSDSV